MIDSKQHIEDIEVGSVRAGLSMKRLCGKSEGVPYSTWASMKARVNAGGEVSVGIVNKLYEALERKDENA